MHNTLHSLDQISWMSDIHLLHQTRLSQRGPLHVLKCPDPLESLVKTCWCSGLGEEEEGLALNIKSTNAAVVESHQISQYLARAKKKTNLLQTKSQRKELWILKDRFAEHRIYLLSIFFRIDYLCNWE